MRADWLLILILAAAPASATSPELELRLDAGEARLGDRIEVDAMARGGDVLWGELTVDVAADGEWAVVDGPREVSGSVPPAWTVTLVPLAVGELELPGFRAGYRGDEGATGQAVAPATTVRVGGVLADEDDTEPSPLKDPVGVRGLPWEWFVPALAVVLPLVAAALWWRSRATRPGRGDFVPLDPLAELGRALDDLRAAVGRESAEAICDRLASAVRRYLERRTGEPALEMTSAELLTLAHRAGWPAVVQRSLHSVLAIADEVRFAHRVRTEAELRAAAERVRELADGLERHLTPAESREEAA